MSVKLPTEHNLKSLSEIGGCTGSSESTLVKVPHCWKSHVSMVTSGGQPDLLHLYKIVIIEMSCG